jgi:hypothetical protein
MLPGIMRLIAGLGALIEAGSAQLSVIRADQLAEVAVRVAERGAQSVLNVADPRPVRLSEIVTESNLRLGTPIPASSLGLRDAIDAGRALGFSEHQVRLIGIDSWLDSTRQQAVAPLEPIGFSLDPSSAFWYQHRGQQ